MRTLFFLALLAGGRFSAHAQEVDVVVYGATPAGIAAALAAAEDGERVLLAEPGSHVGGMLANGLSQGDFSRPGTPSGPYGRFTKRVVEAYRAEFGVRAEEVSVNGTHAEPKVNLTVLEQMLAAQPRITLRTNWALEGAECSAEAEGDAAGAQRALEVALFAEPTGERHSIAARFFIDASYEGDLMAAAGVPYRVGREAASEYHESLAPEDADAEVQAYNFCLCVTDDPKNRVPLRQPGSYRREDFADLLPLLSGGTVGAVFGPGPGRIFRAPAQPLVHHKLDLNDAHEGPVRLSLPGLNEGWPDGGGGAAIREGATSALDRPPFSRLGLATTRQRILTGHQHLATGLLWFLQHDAEVPERFRKEAGEWGWCRDEYPENGHVPEQLYVREARRLLGRYLFTQTDCEPAPGGHRTPPQPDSVAVGEGGPVCVGTGHEGALFGGKHTGDFRQEAPPYQVPFGVMLPQQMENLLVTCAVSASHVGYNALRDEPLHMALGEAAGHAAHLARESGNFVALPVGQLQERLHAAGDATIDVSDVPPGDPLFAAAQWWGDAGGWSGEKSDTAELAQPLTSEGRAKWEALARTLGFEPPPATLLTRGEWLRAAYAAGTARK